MSDSIIDRVIGYLTHDDQALRTAALNWLCEGYMDDPRIAPAVFSEWAERSPEAAYAHFPMLSYFPVAGDQIAQACGLAESLAGQGEKLTHPSSRCAAKLLEQVVQLPAADLAPHAVRITGLAQSHKAFFRVDWQGLLHRIDLLDRPADELAALLDQATGELVDDPTADASFHRGLRALEALRRQHPEYLNLAASLTLPPDDSPAASASLRLTLQSLAQLPSREPVEPELAALLHSDNESITAAAVEALVRSGSGAAAQVLVEQFPVAQQVSRRWIARGLQRMRVQNLAPLIARLSDRVSDPSLWLMLLIGELQQLDPASGPRFVAAIGELEDAAQLLLDAGLLYVFVCGPLQQQLGPAELEAQYREFLARVHSHLAESAPADRPRTRTTRQRNQQLDQLFKKRRRP